MKRSLTLLAALGFAASAQAANLPNITGPQDVSQLTATLNGLIASINAGIPGFGGASDPGINYLDNGAMVVNQRGTADTTGGSTAGCAVLSYPADRWCVDTNVTSGVGHGQVITSSPSPPPGFQKSVKIWRASGSLLQPIMLMQEIETARFVSLQGRAVIGSCYVQPLAGYTGTAALSMNLITGTGTDEGLGALRSAVGMTASPAITPAFTGVATGAMTAAAASPSWTIGTTAAWSRIYSAPFVVPVAATEGAFAIGFTPVGTASGATDGLAITGCQLEAVDNTQITPTSYEFFPVASQLARAQRIYYQLTESATIWPIAGCAAVDTTHTNCFVPFPVTMATAPVLSFANGFASPTSTTQATLGACSTLAAATTVTSTVASVTGALVNCTATTIPAAGIASFLYSNNGTGKIIASADF